jgi:hypothetical protein
VDESQGMVCTSTLESQILWSRETLALSTKKTIFTRIASVK